MGAALKQQENDFDEVFNDISKLYDHAENILQIAYEDAVDENDQLVQEIENVVSQIEESANIIAQDFSTLIENGGEPNTEMKKRVAIALRKMLIAVDGYKTQSKT